jgi:SagB-type dehydrogenase family enzyme
MKNRLIRIHPGVNIINAPFSKEGENLVVNNSITNVFFHMGLLQNDIFLGILHNCLNEIEENDLIIEVSKKFNVDSEEVKCTIVDLIENQILIDSKGNERLIDGEKKWVSKGWSQPFLYHLHTNNIEKYDYMKDPEGEKDRLEMVEKVNGSKIPSIYKKYNRVSIIRLHKPEDYKLSLRKIFVDRVGLDKKKGTISFQEFSRLVYFSFGQTGVKKDKVTGLHISKTSPSGGARHPSETYVFIHDVEDIPSGIYHYDVETHSLSLLSKGDYKMFVQEKIVAHKNRPTFDFKVCFVHSLIFERSMHRYRESRSFRAVNHDLGHLMQTTALLASALNRNSYRGYSLVEKEVESKIGIDGINESAMTYSLIG